ncbi:MAG: hypothetical protein ACFFAU_12880 [Candidatus Hodarchaeota archaeon]
MLILLSPIAVKADQIPIVPMGEMEDTFTPTAYADWNYYILPPGTEYRDVIYQGQSGTSLDTRYTDVRTNDFTNYGRILNRGEFITSSSILRDDSRDSAHDFFNYTIYPRAVRIASDRNPKFVKRERSSLSLHMDYSATFFAQGETVYYGFINTSDPFFLDIDVSGTKVSGEISFSSTHPAMGYTFGVPEKKMTYPFIPINEGLQYFMLETNASTLITLTPHEWKLPNWYPKLELDTIFTEEFDQGDTWYIDKDTDQLVKPDNEMFSLRMFELALEKDQYYRINAVFDMDEVKPGVPGEPPVTFLIGEYYEIISGDLDQGLQIYAPENESLILVMYSPGEAHGIYSIFFQETLPISLYEIEPLTFNTDVTLEYEILYTFTLDNPIVIRINSSDVFQYEIYMKTPTGTWDYKTNQGFIGGTWQYIPAGTYGLMVTSMTTGAEIRFNSVSVQSPSPLAYSINEESILAFELPFTRNRINFVNISTTDHINQSITYSYNIISKYNEFVTTSSSSATIGNEETNGIWNAWPLYNNTPILEYFPVRDHDKPILLLYPTSAHNTTHPAITQTTFSGSVRVTTNVAIDQSYAFKDFDALYDAFSGLNFDGVFIPTSPISSTTNFNVNRDRTIDRNQLYGIQMNLDPYCIYNITAYLIGNYSTTASLNVTFQRPMYAFGANLQEIDIFQAQISDSNDLQAWRSFLILTVSEITYLYLDLYRWGSSPYYNATLQININKIGVQNMEFQLEQEYNDTVNEAEVRSKGLLVKQITPAEMKKASPAFETIIALVALVSFSIVVTKKRRKQVS